MSYLWMERRIFSMRRWRSSASMVQARWMASATPSMSYGLTSRAPFCSWAAAPANSLRMSTPLFSMEQAQNSLATRFMPSLSGVIRATSQVR